jgi:hypothetical protein
MCEFCPPLFHVLSDELQWGTVRTSSGLSPLVTLVCKLAAGLASKTVGSSMC